MLKSLSVSFRVTAGVVTDRRPGQDERRVRCRSSDGPPPTTAPHKERYLTGGREQPGVPEGEEHGARPAAGLQHDGAEEGVSMILQSPAFCEELETMIQDQLKKGKTPTSLLALQQIADFMTTNMPSMYPAAPQGGMAALNMSLGMVTPVNDLRGSDSISYDKGEKLLRCKLAAFYRLADLFGWSELIYNHLTVRVNSDQERFLIVPLGSCTVKINLQGVGHEMRAAAISPEALSLGEVAYHDYHGILVDEEESTIIQRNLGPTSKVLILRNHGLVSVVKQWRKLFITSTTWSLPVRSRATGRLSYRCPALRDKGARSPLKHSFQRGQRDKTRWLNDGAGPMTYEDGPDGSSPKSKPK
ncbi:hypothetical protein INR49_011953, partial [Caranx melampygus]